jgi:hypothetical protein
MLPKVAWCLVCFRPHHQQLRAWRCKSWAVTFTVGPCRIAAKLAIVTQYHILLHLGRYTAEWTEDYYRLITFGDGYHISRQACQYT